MATDTIFAASYLLYRLKRAGIEARPVRDLSLIPAMVEEIGKCYLTSMNSPLENDFTTNTSNWLAAWRDHELIFLGAMRLEDVTDQGVADFWPRVFARHYGGGAPAISDVSPIAQKRLRGRLVYCGDLHVAQSFRSPTSLGIIEDLVDLAQVLAFDKWAPEAFYAIIRRHNVRQGAVHRYRLTSVIDRPYSWIIDPPAPRSVEECCGYILRDEVEDKIAGLASRSEHDREI